MQLIGQCKDLQCDGLPSGSNGKNTARYAKFFIDTEN